MTRIKTRVKKQQTTKKTKCKYKTETKYESISIILTKTRIDK